MCLRFCLSASISPELHVYVKCSLNFCADYTVAMVVDRLSSGGISICYRVYFRFYGWRCVCANAQEMWREKAQPIFKVTQQAAAQNWIHKLTRQEQHRTGGEDWYPRLPCGGNVDLLCTTNTLKSARAAFYRAYLFIRECCSRCGFQPYDRVIIRFVE